MPDDDLVRNLRAGRTHTTPRLHAPARSKRIRPPRGTLLTAPRTSAIFFPRESLCGTRDTDLLRQLGSNQSHTHWAANQSLPLEPKGAHHKFKTGLSYFVGSGQHSPSGQTHGEVFPRNYGAVLILCTDRLGAIQGKLTALPPRTSSRQRILAIWNSTLLKCFNHFKGSSHGELTNRFVVGPPRPRNKKQQVQVDSPASNHPVSIWKVPLPPQPPKQ